MSSSLSKELRGKYNVRSLRDYLDIRGRID